MVFCHYSAWQWDSSSYARFLFNCCGAGDRYDQNIQAGAQQNRIRTNQYWIACVCYLVGDVMSNGFEDDEIYIFVPSKNDDDETDPRIGLWITGIILMIEIGILGYIFWGML